MIQNGMPEHEVAFNVYAVHGEQKDHIARVPDKWEAEKFIERLIAVDNLPGDFHYLLEREVITTTKWLVSRHDSDGTVRQAK